MRDLTRALSGALLLIVLTGCSSSAQQARQMAPTDVVGMVGSSPVTLGEVDVRALQAPASEFGGVRLVQALYLARRVALQEIIEIRLLDQEAKARGIDSAALVQLEISGRATTPTEDDITFWYQAHPERVQGAALAQVHDPIKGLLSAERLDAARTAFIETLKTKTAVTVSLEPPRQTIATDGRPTKGSKDAPIQLVEFSDFQCPFCQRANPTVEQVLRTYGDKIRFVYRHYPLPNHPDARPAAEAAACAGMQDKFWVYHDKLFANSTRLSAADLKAHAASVGLDATRFNDCVDSRESKTTVDEDMRDATAAGVSGTPAFFINGRSLEGAQPFDAFKRVIEEELAIRKP
jgi:protein-disulfide isomerase